MCILNRCYDNQWRCYKCDKKLVNTRFVDPNKTCEICNNPQHICDKNEQQTLACTQHSDDLYPYVFTHIYIYIYIYI